MAFTSVGWKTLASILNQHANLESKVANLKKATREFVNSQQTSVVRSTIDTALDLDYQHRTYLETRYIQINGRSPSSKELSSYALSFISESLSNYHAINGKSLMEASRWPIVTSTLLHQYIPQKAPENIIFSYISFSPLASAVDVLLDKTQAYNTIQLPDTLPSKHLHLAWFVSAYNWARQLANQASERAWNSLSVQNKENLERLRQIQNLYFQRITMELTSNYDSVLHGGRQFLTPDGNVTATHPSVEDALPEQLLSPLVENTMRTLLTPPLFLATHWGWNRIERARDEPDKVVFGEDGF